MRKYNILIFIILFIFNLNPLFSDKKKSKDPLDLEETPRNIDSFKHFVSLQIIENKTGVQYQNLISRNFLLGVELERIKGFSSFNFPSNIPTDLNVSGNSFSYNYYQGSQIRYPFGGIQSKDEIYNFGLNLKYFLLNSPIYLNSKISKNLKGGTFQSEELLYSDLGVSVICSSSTSLGSCNNSGGQIQPNSMKFSISDVSPISVYAGLGVYLVSKIGVFFQLEGNYLLNQKKYNVFVSGGSLGLVSGVNSPNLIDLYLSQKIFETKLTNTNRFSFQYYLGYGFSL